MLNLGDVLRGAAVSNSDTARQMEYIDIDLIDEDPRNFYELRGLDELAANIELCGLQQPLLVRSNPEAPDRVIIVSGHRRRAAIRKLVDGGREDLRRIPCLREVESSSKALQELRLIFANSDNRNLTSAEISKQAEQVTKLLYELKEEGVEFSGRMRDHVAEACKVSKTKIARLQVIRDHLAEPWRERYENEKLVEATAYELAQMPEKHQTIIYEELSQKSGSLNYLYAHEIDNYGKRMAEVDKLTCEQSMGQKFPCSNREAKLRQIVKKGYQWDSCCSRCCAKCDKLTTCKAACPMLGEQIAAAKEAAKTTRKAAKDAKAEQDQPIIEERTKIWRRMAEARKAAGLTVSQCLEAERIYITQSLLKDWPALESGEKKIQSSTDLPFYGKCPLDGVHGLVGLADRLGCSIDYLFCRTDVREMAQEGQRPSGWISGEMPPDDDVRQSAVAVFEVDGESMPAILCEWDAGSWCFPRGGAEISSKCIKWYPVPEEGGVNE